jgi:protein gp37
MAETTGIGWTDATTNFVIGCTKVGPGCDGCYAASLSMMKWGIMFEPGGMRRVTASGFIDPPRWQRKHDAGIMEKPARNGGVIKTPTWVFACSLSDFFDKEWPAEVRARAWAVIKACPSLRWQLVTKRSGLVECYLPDDWNGGKGYEHVGIIATMVNQREYDRDAEKLFNLYRLGVKWTGISIEPQIGAIKLGLHTDWVIGGGESKQDLYERNDVGFIIKKHHAARPYHLEWARDLIWQCRLAGIPYFQKQMGDNPHEYGGYTKRFGKNGGAILKDWPADLRVQEMPRIYDVEPAMAHLAGPADEVPEQPEALCADTPDLFK